MTPGRQACGRRAHEVRACRISRRACGNIVWRPYMADARTPLGKRRASRQQEALRTDDTLGGLAPSPSARAAKRARQQDHRPHSRTRPTTTSAQRGCARGEGFVQTATTVHQLRPTRPADLDPRLTRRPHRISPSRVCYRGACLASLYPLSMDPRACSGRRSAGGSSSHWGLDRTMVASLMGARVPRQRMTLQTLL